MTATAGYVGASLRRREDLRFLTGGATFVDDIALADMAHAAILRSPHAHARILAIDPSAALAMPGVVAVLRFADFAHGAKPIPLRLAPIPGFERFLQFPLAGDKVRFVGEPIAVVIAEDRYLAEDALAHIAVDYEPLDAVVSGEAAMRDAVLVHDAAGTNVAARYSVANGDAGAAFARAPYTRREVFRCHRHGAVPLETRGFVAAYDGDRLTVWGGTKVNFYNRRILADLLGMAEERIEMVELDVGGGFGSRGEFYPEDFLIPLAAVRLGRPVKWIEDRREHLIAANHSREIACELEIAAERDGTLLAMRARIRGDMGAYLRTNGGVVPCKAVQSLPGPYRLPAFSCDVEIVVTNKTPVGTYRAPGRFEATFFRERLFDMAAADLGIDPIEFRNRNLLTAAEMPYRVGKLIPYEQPAEYDIGDMAPMLRRALDELGDEEAAPEDGRLRGLGVACCIDSTGTGPSETARIVIDGDGRVDVYLGVSDMGQGHQTTFAQICADALELDIESIEVHRTGTADIASGYGTYNSRATVMGGSALVATAAEVKQRLVQAAGMRLNLAEADLEYRDGAVHRRGDDGGEPLIDLAGLVVAHSALGLDGATGGTLDVTATFENSKGTHTYGAHAAEVAVDPETGGVEILRYVAVEDIGRAVNPMIVHGQSIGGAVQGIGGAMLEEFVYGPDGQPLSASFADYMLPTSTDVPSVRSVMLEETPSRLNPLGVKGAGEGGIVAPGAVIANAVSAALAGHGVQVTDLPLSPANIRRWIEAGATTRSDKEDGA